ncbi:hypothetical protein ACFTAO_18295 [Paenibacillus rhizoplanae]
MERLPEAEAGNGELLFVNVQPGVLYDPRYKSGETVAYLKELGLAPERIVFELTERQAVQDYIRFEKKCCPITASRAFALLWMMPAPATTASRRWSI